MVMVTSLPTLIAVPLAIMATCLWWWITVGGTFWLVSAHIDLVVDLDSDKVVRLLEPIAIMSYMSTLELHT
ncbi:hypothetical protein [Nonomuraea wenchangensis]|uniref:hypothetical protein n=1 Tax=Nonomuraea wenchangensis TaxID=568860 RepID=UPI0033327933